MPRNKSRVYRASRKPIRRRPVSDEALANSIRYIRMRDKYLQEKGILVQIGKRKWQLNPRK